MFLYLCILSYSIKTGFSFFYLHAHCSICPAETRLIRLDSVLSLDNKLLIRSLGALLGFLFKNRAGGIMLDAEGGVGVFVASLQLLKLDQVLGLDKNTFDALRIFKRVNHPSTSLKSGAVKV